MKLELMSEEPVRFFLFTVRQKVRAGPAATQERQRRHAGGIPRAPKPKSERLGRGWGNGRCHSPYLPCRWVGGGAAPLIGATPLVDPLCRAGGWPPWWVGPSNLTGRGVWQTMQTTLANKVSSRIYRLHG